LTRLLKGRRLRPGTVLTITITKPSWVGEVFAFTMRASHEPRFAVQCLAPGASSPAEGC
jgi:hypothetical protein